MKKHNFNAGPAVLPDYAINETIKAIQDFGGLSILSISHRSKDFDAVMDGAVAATKRLLDIPDDYHVIFLGGGASTQFYVIPYNFLNKKAAYLDTGTWALGGIKEAKLYGEVDVVASSKDKNYSYIPKDYTIPTDADYFEICCNNTIEGTEIRKDMDCPVPLIADMSSDIFSRPVDVSKYAMIFGGAQKNFAPAGVTIVIAREDLVTDNVLPGTPTYMKYKIQADNGSMYNTPPCYGIYICGKVFKWIMKTGGLEAMKERNEKKAALLYDFLDESRMFSGTVVKKDRSLMNVPFVTGNPDLDKKFLAEAEAAGFVNLKGHRISGGMRASIYNAMPYEGVKALVDFMKDFEAKNA